MDSTPHPVAAWMEKHSVDSVRLAVELGRLGRKSSPAYLAEVVSGYYAPSRKLAIALGQITGIDAGEILTFPYRAKRAA